MGKKAKKPGKGKEKTERKTAKAEEKRARRDQKKVSQEDDIDAILMSIQKEEAKKKEVHVEDNAPRPSPRSNCSMNINPTKETELILYGGEFYNGSKTFVYGDLYRYDVEKQEWKLISSPNSPPPRSAHQAVAWKNNLYIYGGEFTSPNQERFHHYKDFWMLDLKTNQWEQLNLKGCPSPRSGHRMVLYKHNIIVFGGFYDTLREVRYFNDLHIFDLDQYKWQEIKPKPGSMWPSARSGFQFFVFQDEIFLYGGYSKEVSTDKNGSERALSILTCGLLIPELGNGTRVTEGTASWSIKYRWTSVKKSGMPPGPRAGFSLSVHKKRALLFGGVVDMEVEGDVMMSLFLNELYGFQLDSHRWYPLELRKEKTTKDKGKTGNHEMSFSLTKKRQESNSVGFSNAKSGTEMLEADEDDEKFQNNEEALDVDGCTDEISHLSMKNVSVFDDRVSNISDPKPLVCNVGAKQQNGISPEVVKPCGRINSCMAVARDTLYIYGGMMEVRDRELCISITLPIGNHVECKILRLSLASECEWLEVSGDEDEDDDDTDDEENDKESESEESDDEDDTETMNGGGKSLAAGDAIAVLKGEVKNVRRKEKRARIEQIRASLGLSDSQRTPVPGESLRDFYRRTNLYWQMAAHEHTQHTGKELRKDGFDLAEARYKELKPILDELAILEAEQKAEEEEGAETSSRKRGDKKSRPRS
ncbi:hypothetical protein Sjap_016372 [Stephania japonica]|uniref:DUF4110 domain-containing protein n=1 Tax=Stephania japonica TaxID=461633 RepID=A0AAP0ILG2_9MAGN